MEKIRVKDFEFDIVSIIRRGKTLLVITFPQGVDLSTMDLSSIEVRNEHGLICTTFENYSTIYKVEGNTVTLSNDESIYVEPIEPEPVVELEPYIPTESELLEIERQKKISDIQLQISMIDSEFASLDYVGIKIATGRATISEYETEISRMNELAIAKDLLLAELITL